MSYKEVTTRTDEPNSLEVSLNSKGAYQWTIKVYGNGEFSEMIQQVKATDDQLHRMFPTAEGIPSPPKAQVRESDEEAPVPEKHRRQRQSRPAEEPPKEETAPPKKRSRKEELVETARKPFPTRHVEEEGEEAPRFPRRRREQ